MVKFSLLFVFIVFLGCEKKDELIKAVKKPITESVYASGIVVSKNQYNVFATVNGIVDKILHEEGDLLTEGSPILTLKSEEQSIIRNNARLASDFNALNSNKDKLNEAKAIIELARTKMESDALMLQRQKDLWAQNIGSKVELEQKSLAYENSVVAFESAKQRYSELDRQLKFLAKQANNNFQISIKNSSDYTVKSKFKGRLYQLNIAEGEIVTPQKSLAIVGDDKSFKLEMQVDEYDIVNIKPGLAVIVALNSYKDAVFNAVVTKINPIMNVQNKSFTVEAEFLSPPEVLYPNISFEANIVIKQKNSALLIPRSYLVNDTMVIDKNGQAIKVTTGLKDYEMVEIVSGLDTNTAIRKPDQ